MPAPKRNWNSPKQVVEVLVEHGIPLPTEKGKVSVSKECLEQIRNKHPLIPLLLRRQELASALRMLNSYRRYIDPADGCIHPYGNTLDTNTGRGKSSHPNTQNVSKKSIVRGIFVARPGRLLIVIDFSQIEPRVLAHFVNPSEFSKLFDDTRDFYDKIGELLFKTGRGTVPPRDTAKVLFLAVTYGMSASSAGALLRVSEQEALDILARFESQYPEITALKSDLIRDAERLGFVQGLLGRRRYIEGLNSPETRIRSKASRQVFNSVIQGSAATLFKYKLVQLRRALPESVKFLMHVHDEVVLEAPESEASTVLAKATESLESPVPWFSIPLKVDGGIGHSWAEAKLNTKRKGGEK